jgi:hypothetical protein
MKEINSYIPWNQRRIYEDESGRLIIKWKSREKCFFIFFAALWNTIVISYFPDEWNHRTKFNGTMIPSLQDAINDENFTTFLIHPLLGIIFAYIAICFLINKTKYSLERGSLEIRKGPLPWFPKKFVLPSSEIEQFYFHENDRRSTEFLLMVRLTNSSNICIDKGIIYLSEVRILEQWLENKLGLQTGQMRSDATNTPKEFQFSISSRQAGLKFRFQTIVFFGAPAILILLLNWFNKIPNMVMWCILIVMAIPGVLMGSLAARQIRSKGIFKSEVSNDRISIACPDPTQGLSFECKPLDILELELSYDTRSERGRGRARRMETWTIVLKNKSRMSVTPSYGHPVNNFIAAIRRLRPELPVREYDRGN